MSRKQISQAEARRLRKRVVLLERQIREFKSSFGHAYQGVHIGTCNFDAVRSAELRMALRLGRVISVRHYTGDTFSFHALDPSKVFE